MSKLFRNIHTRFCRAFVVLYSRSVSSVQWHYHDFPRDTDEYWLNRAVLGLSAQPFRVCLLNVSLVCVSNETKSIFLRQIENSVQYRLAHTTKFPHMWKYGNHQASLFPFQLRVLESVCDKPETFNLNVTWKKRIVQMLIIADNHCDKALFIAICHHNGATIAASK